MFLSKNPLKNTVFTCLIFIQSDFVIILLKVKVVNHDNVHENYVDDLILEEDIYVDDDEPFVAERFTERVVSTF